MMHQDSLEPAVIQLRWLQGLSFTNTASHCFSDITDTADLCLVPFLLVAYLG